LFLKPFTEDDVLAMLEFAHKRGVNIDEEAYILFQKILSPAKIQLPNLEEIRAISNSSPDCSSKLTPESTTSGLELGNLPPEFLTKIL